MSLVEPLPTISRLHRADTLPLIQLLAEDVARDETAAAEGVGVTVPIWSQYDARDGAAELLRALEQDECKTARELAVM